MTAQVRFRLRITRDETIAIGPGKVALLEAIIATGSISAAAREMGMSYRRAWLLIDELNRCLVKPAVDTAAGGAQGGGTTVTAIGKKLISHYRNAEKIAGTAAAADIKALVRLVADDS